MSTHRPFVRLSVCLSVCLSGHLSVSHLSGQASGRLLASTCERDNSWLRPPRLTELAATMYLVKSLDEIGYGWPWPTSGGHKAGFINFLWTRYLLTPGIWAHQTYTDKVFCKDLGWVWIWVTSTYFWSSQDWFYDFFVNTISLDPRHLGSSNLHLRSMFQSPWMSSDLGDLDPLLKFTGLVSWIVCEHDISWLQASGIIKLTLMMLPFKGSLQFGSGWPWCHFQGHRSRFWEFHVNAIFLASKQLGSSNLHSWCITTRALLP